MKIRDFYNKLTAPFPSSEVKWRIGSMTKDKSRGMALAYVDARTVANRLDEATNYFGWQCHYSHAGDNSHKTICNLGVYLPMGHPDADIGDAEWNWIWRADGAGDTDFEGDKGAISDAFKRAGVRFGICRYLYDLDAPWVSVKDGRYIVDTEIPKLRALHDKVAAKISEKSGPESISPAALIAAEALRNMGSIQTVEDFGKKNAVVIKQMSIVDKAHFSDVYKKVMSKSE